MRSLAECLLAIPPPATAPAEAIVESYFNSLLPPAAVTAALQARARRCTTRTLALSLFADLFERSCSALCVEALRTMAPVARGRFQHLLLEDVIGCPPAAVAALKQAFNRTFALLAETLADSEGMQASSYSFVTPPGSRASEGSRGSPSACHAEVSHWPCDELH